MNKQTMPADACSPAQVHDHWSASNPYSLNYSSSCCWHTLFARISSLQQSQIIA